MKSTSLLILFAFTLFSCAQTNQSQQADIAAINEVLDGYHQAAANGEWDVYFDLMSDDGVFIGTDAQERWVKQEFRRYSSGGEVAAADVVAHIANEHDPEG